MRAMILALLTSAVPGAEVEFVRPAWAPPAGFPATLRDVASRLPSSTDAKDADLITYAHEGTHFLSSGRKPGHHGIYVGRGMRVFIPTPPVRTADVFAAVPLAKRGTIYETYRKQGEHSAWANQPLMVLDEWNAYLMGSLTRMELRVEVRRETNVHCATMSHYAATLYRLAKERPGYPIKELKDFCNWQLSRCRDAIPDWDELSDARFD